MQVTVEIPEFIADARRIESALREKFGHADP